MNQVGTQRPSEIVSALIGNIRVVCNELEQIAEMTHGADLALWMVRLEGAYLLLDEVTELAAKAGRVVSV